MIGHEDEEQEVHFKVADRRKFNPDGSVKDGVVLDAAPPKPAPVPAAEPPKAEAKESGSADAALSDDPATTPSAAVDDGEPPFDDELSDEGEDADIDDLPGAHDPASFVNFLSTLATNAAAALGAVPHPATGQRTLDLETGKYWLDILAMLRDKTKGNLHEKEQRLLDGLLGDLRMQYVQLVRATEERLKAQAAAKFSGDDILGKSR